MSDFRAFRLCSNCFCINVFFFLSILTAVKMLTNETDDITSKVDHTQKKFYMVWNSLLLTHFYAGTFPRLKKSYFQIFWRESQTRYQNCQFTSKIQNLRYQSIPKNSTCSGIELLWFIYTRRSSYLGLPKVIAECVVDKMSPIECHAFPLQVGLKL